MGEVPHHMRCKWCQWEQGSTTGGSHTLAVSFSTLYEGSPFLFLHHSRHLHRWRGPFLHVDTLRWSLGRLFPLPHSSFLQAAAAGGWPPGRASSSHPSFVVNPNFLLLSYQLLQCMYIVHSASKIHLIKCFSPHDIYFIGIYMQLTYEQHMFNIQICWFWQELFTWYLYTFSSMGVVSREGASSIPPPGDFHPSYLLVPLQAFGATSI